MSFFPYASSDLQAGFHRTAPLWYLSYILYSHDQDAIYQDLNAGRVDGALSPSVGITFGFLKKQEGQDFELKGPEVTDDNLFSAGSAYGIRKNDDQTKRLINKGIQNIINDGTFEKLKKRYFGNIDLNVKK